MLSPKEICTGCGSCAAVCPQNCIQMIPDSEGFRQPVIDAQKCIECRRCEQACPLISPIAPSGDPKAYAVKNKNGAIRSVSSSGGVFSALAEAVLADNGAVCAAKYDEKFRVVHDIAFSSDELDAFRGAKYAQSRAEHCFPEIRKLLKAGTKVLFVGTPCQTAGLQRYLGQPDPKLLLVDMVCHGVPSPKVWEQYLQSRQQMDAGGAGLRSVNLRSKSTGWSRYSYSVEMEYEDGSKYSVPQGQDWFMQGFVQNLYLRHSCSQCSFKGTQRTSDLTLGDCWGIWDIAPEFDDDQGTSLLLIQSPKGEAAWNAVSAQFYTMALNMEQAIARNPSAVCSSVPHARRGQFFAGHFAGDIAEQIQNCLTEPTKPSFFQRLKKKICRR